MDLPTTATSVVSTRFLREYALSLSFRSVRAALVRLERDACDESEKVTCWTNGTLLDVERRLSSVMALTR